MQKIYRRLDQHKKMHNFKKIDVQSDWNGS